MLPVLSISDAVASEGSSNFDKFLTFTLTLTEPAVNDVTVNFATVSGTALNGADYDVLGEDDVVVIPAGHDSGAISVRTVADNAVETDEFFTLELTNVTNAVFAGGVELLRGAGTIRDDDGGGAKLGLFVVDHQILEGAVGNTRVAGVPVMLSRPFDQEITLEFETQQTGDATAGTDYTTTTGTVTFKPGQTVAGALVPVIGDRQ